MKHLILTLLLVVCGVGLAQEKYSIDGEELTLYEEESGTLTLLSERSSRSYRYFLKKDNFVQELTEANFKGVLEKQTADVEVDVSSVAFNARSLTRVVQTYNVGGKEAISALSDIQIRLGAWGGINNVSSFANETNKNIPFTGLEVEVYDAKNYSKNSLIAQLRGTFPKDDEVGLELIELMLGYRFKLVDTHSFHFYLEAELVTLGIYQETFAILDSQNQLEQISQSSTSLSAPIGLGAGMAYRVYKDVFVTLGYSNLYKVGESTRSDFPVDVRFGFKVRL